MSGAPAASCRERSAAGAIQSYRHAGRRSAGRQAAARVAEPRRLPAGGAELDGGHPAPAPAAPAARDAAGAGRVTDGGAQRAGARPVPGVAPRGAGPAAAGRPPGDRGLSRLRRRARTGPGALRGLPGGSGRRRPGSEDGAARTGAVLAVRVAFGTFQDLRIVPEVRAVARRRPARDAPRPVVPHRLRRGAGAPAGPVAEVVTAGSRAPPTAAAAPRDSRPARRRGCCTGRSCPRGTRTRRRRCRSSTS